MRLSTLSKGAELHALALQLFHVAIAEPVRCLRAAAPGCGSALRQPRLSATLTVALSCAKLIGTWQQQQHAAWQQRRVRTVSAGKAYVWQHSSVIAWRAAKVLTTPAPRSGAWQRLCLMAVRGGARAQRRRPRPAAAHAPSGGARAQRRRTRPAAAPAAAAAPAVAAAPALQTGRWWGTECACTSLGSDFHRCLNGASLTIAPPRRQGWSQLGY